MQPREFIRIGERRQPGLGKGLGDIGKDRRRFGEHALVRHQRRHPALRIDRKELGTALLAIRKIHAHEIVIGPRILERDAGGERAGALSMEKFQHG